MDKSTGKRFVLTSFAALAERIKYFAYLHGDKCIPGAKSQILLDTTEGKREFDVSVDKNGSLELFLR